MTVFEALTRYLQGDSPKPHLAIQEPELSPEQMQEMGFEQMGEYWVISLEDARKLVESSSGVDYERHWREERERPDFHTGARGSRPEDTG
jgi:hypothetical protein